jgi:putative transposase
LSTYTNFLTLPLADLSITKTHSRPHVSDDNPFSESQFKTMKYRPDFPQRFGSQQDALAFCRPFFDWYNNQHHHSALCFLTPAQVHHGHASALLARRQATLDAAYSQHPERFPNGPPRVHQLPREVWINPPQNLNEPQPPSADVVVRTATRSHHEPLISIHSN